MKAESDRAREIFTVDDRLATDAEIEEVRGLVQEVPKLIRMESFFKWIKINRGVILSYNSMKKDGEITPETHAANRAKMEKEHAESKEAT